MHTEDMLIGLVVGSRIGPVTSGFSRLATNQEHSYLSDFSKNVFHPGSRWTAYTSAHRLQTRLVFSPFKSGIVREWFGTVFTGERPQQTHRARAVKCECCPAETVISTQGHCFCFHSHVLHRCWTWTETSCGKVKVPSQVEISTGKP